MEKNVLNILTITGLLACIDNSFEKKVEDVGDTVPCDCVDYSEKIAELEASIEELRNRDDQISSELQGSMDYLDDIDTRISAVEDATESSGSSLIVSEYEVLCTAGRDSTDNPILTHPYSVTRYNGDTYDWGCHIANIDPDDPPFSISIGTVMDLSTYYPQYSRSGSIALYGSDRPELYNPYMNFGNDLNYWPLVFNDVLNSTSYITSDGKVFETSYFYYGVQPDYSSGSLTYKDVPMRVVIMDDKSYTAP